MDMLDMGRRSSSRTSGAIKTDVVRDVILREAFERSPLPQALLSAAGTLAFANTAFTQLIGAEGTIDGVHISETALASYIPGLVRAARAVATDGKPTERRAKIFRGAGQTPLEVIMWLAPLPVDGNEIQMIVRLDESARE
jgi:hypothetical protein